jgi:hypothetical protein
MINNWIEAMGKYIQCIIEIIDFICVIDNSNKVIALVTKWDTEPNNVPPTPLWVIFLGTKHMMSNA